MIAGRIGFLAPGKNKEDLKSSTFKNSIDMGLQWHWLETPAVAEEVINNNNNNNNKKES